MNATTNKLIACKPFPKQHMEKIVKGGFAMLDKKVTLQELEVVMRSYDTDIDTYDKVYVRGDAGTQNWAKEVFTQGDLEFILVPFAAIQFVDGGAKWQDGF